MSDRQYNTDNERLLLHIIHLLHELGAAQGVSIVEPIPLTSEQAWANLQKDFEELQP